MEAIELLLEWIVDTLISTLTSFIGPFFSAIIAVPLYVLALIGGLMPTCTDNSLGLGFTNQVLDALVNGVRFWWPLLKWFPWEYAWQMFSAWILYQTIKALIRWLPTIVGWFVSAVEWVITFIEGIIPG